METLKHFCKKSYANTRAKHLTFLAIPMDLLLHGYKSWALGENFGQIRHVLSQKYLENPQNINPTSEGEDNLQQDHLKNSLQHPQYPKPDCNQTDDFHWKSFPRTQSPTCQDAPIGLG